MNYNTYKESTKTNKVFIIMPKSIIIVEPELKNNRLKSFPNIKNLVRFEETQKNNMATFYYELPNSGIALEEYLDYIVVNVGITAPENRFNCVMDIAENKEKGLILKPPTNPSKLYLMDRIVVTYNDLYDYKNIRF